MILRSSVFDWLVVLVNPDKRTEDVIVNDAEALSKYYEENKSEIWTGYNSTLYDQYILKGILCVSSPDEDSREQCARWE